MHNETMLKNKVRVVTKELANTKSVTVLILVGAGSRYETREINGVSHFLEHMFFKGAKKYPDTRAVSEAIDGVGGEFNAFTGKEYVGYYVKVRDQHIGTAMDVLSDMLLHSKFEQEEIERERGVIMEEYNMYQDTPMQQIGWDFERLIYGDQPMGWDQVGTKETIHALNRPDFVDYKDKLYSPDNTVIAVAGNVDHDDVVKRIEELFTFDDTKKAFEAPDVKPMASDERVYLRKKKTEQGHIMLGVPAYDEQHKDYYALKMLSIILGGGMSSRMFLSVRERQGLAYYISSSVDGYTDSGTFSTNAGVTVEKIDDAIKAILAEYKTVVYEKVPESELVKAKEYLKGSLVLRLEDSEEFAHLMGKYVILYNQVRTPEEVFALVDKVTVEDVQRVAQDILHQDKLYLSVIGPYEDAERFEKLLKL